MKRGRLDVIAAIALGLLLAASSAAQDTTTSALETFPSRPVRVIVPYAPGNGADIVTRTIAEELARIWKQQVVVDNRPGASGIIATQEFKRSRVDGHDYLMGDVGNLAINPNVYRTLPYDVEKDLVPVTDLMRAPWVLFVPKESPIKTLGDFIAAAKAQPGQLTYGSTGTGAPNFMAAELLKLRAGIDLLQVPFKDGNQLHNAVATGQVTLMISSWTTARSLIDRLTPLAVTAKARQAGYPHIPTVEEAGGPPGFVVHVWAAWMARAETPKPIRDKVYADLVSAMKNPEVKRRIDNLGFELGGRGSEEIAALIRAETERYREVVAAAKIQKN